MTYTIATLRVSPPTYEEIARLLLNAGYKHLFSGDDIVTIDMSGIGIQVDDRAERSRDGEVIPASQELVLDGERNLEGNCAVCEEKLYHVSNCATLKRRLAKAFGQGDDNRRDSQPAVSRETGIPFRSGRPVHRSDADVIKQVDPQNSTAPIPDAEAVGANTRQVGGEHYGLKQFQHWDMVVMFDLDYFQGQITKYVLRWHKKGGLKDLEKAQHFLEKYIEEIRAGRIVDPSVNPIGTHLLTCDVCRAKMYGKLGEGCRQPGCDGMLQWRG